MAADIATFQFNNPKVVESVSNGVSLNMVFNKLRNDEFDRLKFMHAQIKSKIYFLQSFQDQEQGQDATTELESKIAFKKQQIHLVKGKRGIFPVVCSSRTS